MRLTLRTMLAYMDGVLSPADAEELRRKIELNEGAAGIMQRVRDVTCRMRLGAPKVDSHGMGGDANAVAEYLNDLMPSDRVPEFERVCLESDARLAEVAACHHILALVLSEPAEVDPEMRRRLYGLIDLPERHAEAPPVAEPPVAVEVEAAAPPKTRRKLGVPEYLREGSPSRGWVKWAIGVSALLVLGAIGAVAAVGPQQLLSRLGVAPAGREVASNDSAPNENAADGDSRTPSGANEEDSATEDGAGDKAATPSPREDEESAAADAEEATSDDANTAPSLAPVSEDADAATSEEDAAPAPPTPDETANAATSDEAEATSVEEGASEPEVAEGAPSPGANEMGVVYIQDKAVLLRYSSAEEIWKRLSQGDGVAQGDRLMSLPHFRPGVTLSNGVGIYFRGAAQVVLEGPDVDGTPGFA